MKTWEDIERAAYGDAGPWLPTDLPTFTTGNMMLRYAVNAVRAGHATKEQALIALALHYAESTNDWIKMETERRALEMPSPFVPDRYKERQS